MSLSKVAVSETEQAQVEVKAEWGGFIRRTQASTLTDMRLAVFFRIRLGGEFFQAGAKLKGEVAGATIAVDGVFL